MTTRQHTALCMSALAITASANHVPVEKVTIVPCNNALGYVQSQPKDSPLETLEDNQRRLELALTGPLAEELFLGGTTTSFGEELGRALRIAQRMNGLGDKRPFATILNDSRDAVRRRLTAQEGKIRQLAAVLVREGTLDAHAVQQVIGGC